MKRLAFATLFAVLLLALTTCGSGAEQAQPEINAPDMDISAALPEDGTNDLADLQEDEVRLVTNADISDEEVHLLYQRAVESLSWFDLTTMPGESLGWDGAIEMYGIRYDVRVVHDRINSLAELKEYLSEIFTEDFVDTLFANYVYEGPIRRFIDIDGVLHTFGADRGTNILAGEIRYAVIRQSAGEIIYQVSVDIHDWDTPWYERNPDNAVDIEISDFVLVNVDGAWLFTDFWLVV